MKIHKIIIMSILLSLAFFTVFSPVDVLVISCDENVQYSMPVNIGYRFETLYIHSVEQTPVEDDYRVVGGRIWSWEERVLSQNAGMPFVKPRNGRLIVDNDWLRFRGGRHSWQELFYRIGDSDLGKNKIFFWAPNPGTHDLFVKFPLKLFVISVEKNPLVIALFHQKEL